MTNPNFTKPQRETQFKQYVNTPSCNILHESSQQFSIPYTTQLYMHHITITHYAIYSNMLPWLPHLFHWTSPIRENAMNENIGHLTFRQNGPLGIPSLQNTTRIWNWITSLDYGVRFHMSYVASIYDGYVRLGLVLCFSAVTSTYTATTKLHVFQTR